MSYQSTTPKFDLPQWVYTDPPQMNDFNTAFSNIDSKAQPQTEARSTLVKADASGALVAAVKGTDYNRLQYTTLWQGFKTGTGSIALSDNMKNYGAIVVVTAANNITQQCISNLFLASPGSAGLNGSNMRFLCSNPDASLNGQLGPNGDFTKINIVQAPTTGHGICLVIGIK